jgi:GTP cyclohydrolase I
MAKEYRNSKFETERLLGNAYTSLYHIPQIADSIKTEHTKRSPARIVESIFEMFDGCWQDPDEVLNVTFKDTYDEIVYINDISFVSSCAHHNLPFFGKMHFGYLPEGQIVGLSKIPRLVEIYAHRPQVQEKLTQDIVDKFMEKITPKGCGLVVEAYHFCCAIRGVKQRPAYTKTTALRGVFKTAESTKQEFLQGIKKTTEQLWP